MRRGTHSIGELLGNEPHFFFQRGDNKLTHNNSGNIVLLVDSVEKDLSTLNMHHLRYDYVEIVDHPTGRYQGYDVLINLHTKKDYEGYEGYMNDDSGILPGKPKTPFFEFTNNQVGTTYTKNKLTLSGSVYFYGGWASTSFTKRFLKNFLYKADFKPKSVIRPNECLISNGGH